MQISGVQLVIDATGAVYQRLDQTAPYLLRREFDAKAVVATCGELWVGA